MMGAMVDAAKPGFLASLLVVNRRGDGEFEARLHAYGGNAGTAFGGDVLGRVALAAARTCEGKALHALHGSFLRPAPAAVALRIRVEALADGRRLARRRVEMRSEDGRLVFEATASFAAPGGDGPAWQEAAMPAVPAPVTLPPDVEVAREAGWTDWNLDEEEFAWGFVDRPWRGWDAARPEPSEWSLWLRPRHPLPDDPLVHAAALAFSSDFLSPWAASRRVGRRLEAGDFVSLDHALRVHDAARWDDWRLFHDTSEIARGGRAYWHRRIFARDGTLLASATQEGLLSRKGPG
jgi:acyl-CoA thioesterase-2